MSGAMKMNALALAMQGVILAAPTMAGEECFRQVDMACVPCGQDGADTTRENCRAVNGKRIDRGASLGARATPGPNAERELGQETFVLSDALPVTAVSPATTSVPVALPATGPARLRETRKIREESIRPMTETLSEPLFESGGSALTGRMKSSLDALADQLRGRANLRLQVVGHTDTEALSAITRARFGDNHGLGMARAKAAATYLATVLELPPDRIGTESRGPDQPVADNASPGGMARNRRIEIQASYDLVQVTEREVVIEHPAPALPEPQPAPPPVAAVPIPPRDCKDVLASRQRAGETPFRISIDGVPQDGPGVIDADIQRCTDVALERGELQLRYDPLQQKPVLNTHAWPNAVARGTPVEFVAYANYAAFIQRAEIRLFRADASTQGAPLAILPVGLGERVAWIPSERDMKSVRYLLRVYDRAGRFDETRARTLDIVEQARPTEDLEDPRRERLAGYGENSLVFSNIPVSGGVVTVNGTGIRPGESVRFLGAAVPVDAAGAFAARQILPAGSHVVEVAVLNDRDEAVRSYARNIYIADADWFYLGIADLTLGRNTTTGPAKLVTAEATDHFDNQVFVDGRLAFYLKGKIKGESLLRDWELTASADTREQPLRDLFSNFSAKDPRYLLRRLDPDKYYPVYGDDSTTVDDAPTQGKFFVRLEKGESQVLWGSFHTSFTGTEFTNFSRGLYGARARFASEATTGHGEKRSRMEVFAADPGTMQSREEFRGTGGSLYYLRHIDITPGSERAWIEVRDKDSGLVLNTRQLVAVQDYEVNALQGRIILREPLASTSGAGTLVQAGSLGGHPVHLVVTYEYAPGVFASEDLAMGGRGTVWVNDHVKIGASAFRQDGQRQRLHGLDATLRFKPGTFLKLEGARSDGAGGGAWSSPDGGFSFNAVPGGPSGKADARRVEAGLDFAEFSEARGKATFYWQDRDAGFSGPGRITAEAVEQAGGSVSWQVSSETEVLAKLDRKEAASQDSQSAEVNLRQRFSPNWTAGLGLRHDDLDTRVANASSILSQSGGRADLVARLEYLPDEKEKADWSAYGYVQGTLERDAGRDANDRVGVGGEKRINDRFKLGGELSEGAGGLGARISGDWRVDDRTSFYSSYTLTPDRTDDGYRGRAGLFTAGGKSRFSDAVGVHVEERYQHGEGPAGLTHAFGLDLSPNDRWTYGLKLEAGDLSDPLSGDLRRQALGFTAGYRRDATRYAGALEYRHEKGTTTRNTWLLKNTLGYQVNPDWRFLGRFNLSISDSGAGAMQDGKYAELVAGYAWRPVNNDRWNTLFKYTGFYNLPSPGQVGISGAMLDYAQRSHVLSVDTIHDLRPWVSVGGKLGYRRGELKDTKVGGTWQDSTAFLGILRADWHWVHEWDVLTELRYLDANDAGDSKSGALVAVYRHLGKNFKLGGGYNFTDFSDDLTDLSYRSHGWFINLIGKI